MKINLAKSAGFCFGVKRALEIAHKTLAASQDVYMTGDIVHNEEIIKEIKNAGMEKIKKFHSSGIGKTFLIQAHGAGLALINKATRLGYNIVDATCPMVKEIHSIAKDMENKGYKIIIIGDKNHDEVLGIIGQLKSNPIIIEGLKGVAWGKFKKINKAAVVAQSTQDIVKVEKIIRALKLSISELEFFNTICRPTRLKQGEIRKLPSQNDVMVIIGSKTSANTRRLYEISKEINKKSFWVQSRRDLKPAWFKNARNIGIAAGASTPDRAIKEIVKLILTADKTIPGRK